MGHEGVRWHCHTKVEKYASDEDFEAGKTFDVVEKDGNLLMYGGASTLWERLCVITPVNSAFDSTHANIGVGDSTTAEAPTQQDLAASTNKLRKAVDSVTHTDNTTSSANAQVVFAATFGSSDANFAWQEWGVFNAASGGRMLNRKVESLGTKASGSTWVLTITLSLA